MVLIQMFCGKNIAQRMNGICDMEELDYGKRKNILWSTRKEPEWVK